MTAIRAVLFDLDGTLIESWPAHVRSLRAACATAGLPAPSAARLASAQRGTDRATVGALAGDAAFPAYQAAFARELARRPPAPVRGAAAVLAGLDRAGLRTGVCTGRSGVAARAALRAAELPIAVLAAREQGEKPAPQPLWHALEVLGLTPAQAVYVGDAALDGRQGAAAGIPTVLIGRRVPARSAAAAPAALADLADLTDWLLRRCS
jgi:phosphoglycolate phosphatase